MGWGGSNTGSTPYGTSSGVQDYISAFTFTSSSNPSTVDVSGRIANQSLVMDGMLYKAGFAMPITDSDAVSILTTICEMYVAADMWERIVLGREPSRPKVETAEIWRSRADQMMTDIVEGRLALGDDLLATGRLASVVAGVSNATAITSDESLDDFVDNYGGQFYISDTD